MKYFSYYILMIQKDSLTSNLSYAVLRAAYDSLILPRRVPRGVFTLGCFLFSLI